MVSFIFIMGKKVWVALAVELLRDHLRKSNLLVKVTRINKDMAVWNGFFYVKGRIRMPPGARLCAPQFYVPLWNLQAWFALWTKALLVCVCVCIFVFFSLLCTLPTGLCLRTVPIWLVPLILDQAPICGQVSLFLNLAGQKNLFLHSQDCCEGLDWDWLWVSSYL